MNDIEKTTICHGHMYSEEVKLPVQEISETATSELKKRHRSICGQTL